MGIDSKGNAKMALNPIKTNLNGYNCSICLDSETDSILKEVCPIDSGNGGHSFHTECFAKSIKDATALCPVCRVDLTDIIAVSDDPALQPIQNAMQKGNFQNPNQHLIYDLEASLPHTNAIRRLQLKYERKSTHTIIHKLQPFFREDMRLRAIFIIAVAQATFRRRQLSHEITVALIEFLNRNGDVGALRGDTGCTVM